jgi:hypothetical protein
MNTPKNSFEYACWCVNRMQINEYFAFMRQHGAGEDAQFEKLYNEFVDTEIDIDFYPKLKAFAEKHFTTT